MKTLGNILWHFPFFGFISASIVYLLGMLFTATVVGAPVGLGLMEFGKFLFAPFGHAMVSRTALKVEQNKAWKTYSTIVMILYFPLGLFLAFVVIFQIAALFISIIGIPAALVLAKSLGTYFNPVNKMCVSSAVAAELEKRKGQAEVDKYLDPSDDKKQMQNTPTRSAIDQPLPDVQPESSQCSTSGRTVPNWLMPAVAGGAILVLVAGGIIYYQKSQNEEKLVVQQSHQQQGMGDANASGLEMYNGTWTDGDYNLYEITYTGDSDRIRLRMQYNEIFLKYSGGKLLGDAKDFYFKLLANGELFHGCSECSPDRTLKRTEKRIPFAQQELATKETSLTAVKESALTSVTVDFKTGEQDRSSGTKISEVVVMYGDAVIAQGLDVAPSLQFPPGSMRGPFLIPITYTSQPNEDVKKYVHGTTCIVIKPLPGELWNFDARMEFRFADGTMLVNDIKAVVLSDTNPSTCRDFF